MTFMMDLADNEACILLTDRGFKKAVRGQTVNRALNTWVYKKSSGAPPIEFWKYDTATGDWRLHPLLNPDTGKIDLRKHICCPLPFRVSTADEPKSFWLTARIGFSLDFDRLEKTYWVADFSDEFSIRIMDAFQDHLAGVPDEDIGKRRRDIESAVLHQLVGLENATDQSGLGVAPLGVNFSTVNFDYVRVDKGYDVRYSKGLERALRRAMGDDLNERDADDSGEAGKTPGLDTAALLSPSSYDDIADLFRRRDEVPPIHDGINQAVLEVLRLHTQQRVAEALAESKSTVVLSTDDVGLTGSNATRELLRDWLRDHASAGAGSSAGGAQKDPDPDPPE